MESSTNHASNLFNKIFIPVLTTVLGTAAIYFLGFNSKKTSGRTDMEQLLITKEATMKGWKSFVTTENVEYKNMKSIAEEFNEKMTKMAGTSVTPETLVAEWTDFKDDLFRETKKANKDVEGILQDKDIDRDFSSFLTRALDNGNEDEKKSTVFFNNIVSLIKSDLPPQEKATKYQAEVTNFTEGNKKFVDRAATEAESIGKILADRYSGGFDLSELLIYADYKKGKEQKPDSLRQQSNTGVNTNTNVAPSDPTANQTAIEPKLNDDLTTRANNAVTPTLALLAGQWEMTGGVLELSKSGDMYWSLTDGRYTSGDWQLQNGMLRMNATNPDTKKTSLMIGSISEFTRSSFTLTLNPQSGPKEVYRLRKKADY